MAVHHPGLQQEVDDFMGQIRALVTASIQNAAIGSAGLRVYDGGWITIENGGLSVTGTASVSGRLEGSGTFDWTGPMWLRGAVMLPGNLTGVGTLLWSGPWELRGTGEITGNTTGTGSLNWTGPWTFAGNGDITGNVDISGALDVLNRLTLGPSGYIEAGSVRIDRGGGYGGRVASTGVSLALSAGGSVIIDAPDLIAHDISATNATFLGNILAYGGLDAQGTVSANVKNFKIPHPTRHDHWLRHGCTESPVAGVEYAGTVEFDANGEAVVELPEYFEALTKVDGRTVHITPIGRPFMAGADLPADGKFTAYGEPGRECSWLVKAERVNAEFEIEEPVFGPLRENA